MILKYWVSLKIVSCFLNIAFYVIQTRNATNGFDLANISYYVFDIESKEGVVMFSGKVQKWNKYGIKQERNLIITNLNVYNFKKKDLRRAFPI